MEHCSFGGVGVLRGVFLRISCQGAVIGAAKTSRQQPFRHAEVAVAAPQGTNNVLVLSGNAEDTLYIIADAMMTIGNNNVIAGNGNPVLFISPGLARLLVEQGFPTRRSVQEYLHRHARIPVDRFPSQEIVPSKPMANRTVIDGKVCVVREPEDLLVVVTGGPEPYHTTYCASIGDCKAVTRAVTY